LLDHLVGEQLHRGRHREPERLCGLKIDDELELRRLDDGKIDRLRTPEDPASVDANLPIGIFEIGAVAHQATGLDEFSPLVYCSNRMPRREGHDFVPPSGEEWVRGNDQPIRPLLNQACESRLEVALTGGLKCLELYTGFLCGLLHPAGLERRDRT